MLLSPLGKKRWVLCSNGPRSCGAGIVAYWCSAYIHIASVFRRRSSHGRYMTTTITRVRQNTPLHAFSLQLRLCGARERLQLISLWRPMMARPCVLPCFNHYNGCMQWWKKIAFWDNRTRDMWISILQCRLCCAGYSFSSSLRQGENTHMSAILRWGNVSLILNIYSGVPRYSVISTLCKSFVFSTNWRVTA